MRWYNKDKTQMIDLDKVESYFYSLNCRELSFYISGREYKSVNEEAEEIFNILKNKKEVL
jgi:hypothetical protein